MVDGGTYWLNAILHPGAIVFLKTGGPKADSGEKSVAAAGGKRHKQPDTGPVAFTVGACRPH